MCMSSGKWGYSRDHPSLSSRSRRRISRCEIGRASPSSRRYPLQRGRGERPRRRIRNPGTERRRSRRRQTQGRSTLLCWLHLHWHPRKVVQGAALRCASCRVRRTPIESRPVWRLRWDTLASYFAWNSPLRGLLDLCLKIYSGRASLWGSAVRFRVLLESSIEAEEH